MSHYVDTSAFVKLCVRERRSTAMRRWALDHEGALVGSDLLRTEALRAARRHSPVAVQRVRATLDSLVLLVCTTDVFARAAELDPAVLRSLDAVHLAAALTLGDELESIVTYDDRMAHATALLGIRVTAP